MTIVVRGLLGPLLITGGLGGAARTLREAVRAWLAGQAAVSAIVGQRIYFGVPSQMAAYPCLVVTVPHRSYGHNLSGADGTSVATVEITAVASYESQCVALAEAIRDFADGFRGPQSGVAIMSCSLDEPAEADPVPDVAPDGSDDRIYRVTLDYRIKHRVPVPSRVTQAFA